MTRMLLALTCAAFLSTLGVANAQRCEDCNLIVTPGGGECPYECGYSEWNPRSWCFEDCFDCWTEGKMCYYVEFTIGPTTRMILASADCGQPTSTRFRLPPKDSKLQVVARKAVISSSAINSADAPFLRAIRGTVSSE